VGPGRFFDDDAETESGIAVPDGVSVRGCGQGVTFIGSLVSEAFVAGDYCSFSDVSLAGDHGCVLCNTDKGKGLLLVRVVARATNAAVRLLGAAAREITLRDCAFYGGESAVLVSDNDIVRIDRSYVESTGSQAAIVAGTLFASHSQIGSSNVNAHALQCANATLADCNLFGSANPLAFVTNLRTMGGSFDRRRIVTETWSDEYLR
jgi:hypothetical protein